MDSGNGKPVSGTILKDTGKGNSSQWAELWAAHILIQFGLKEKWQNV